MKKVIPNIGNAFDFFGGHDESQKLSFPEGNEPLLQFYLVPDSKEYKHKISSASLMGDGWIKCVHRGEERNYHCQLLTSDYHGYTITVIPNHSGEIAWLYLEKEGNPYHEFLKDNELHFIGVGRDHTIRSIDDLWMVKAARLNRLAQKKLQDKLQDYKEKNLSDNMLLMEGNHKKLSSGVTAIPAPPDAPQLPKFQEPAEDIHDNEMIIEETKKASSDEIILDDFNKLLEDF